MSTALAEQAALAVKAKPLLFSLRMIWCGECVLFLPSAASHLLTPILLQIAAGNAAVHCQCDEDFGLRCA